MGFKPRNETPGEPRTRMRTATIQTKNQFYRFASFYSPPSGGQLHVQFVSLVPEFPPGPHFPVARHMQNCNCPLMLAESQSSAPFQPFISGSLFTLRAHLMDIFHWDDGENTKCVPRVCKERTVKLSTGWLGSPLQYCVVGSSRTVGMTRVAALTCPVWRRTCGLFKFVPIPRTRAEYRQRMKDATGGSEEHPNGGQAQIRYTLTRYYQQ
ncbi:hypothetical protein V8C40DRAFT_147940 [Trichoderma camerunense]